MDIEQKDTSAPILSLKPSNPLLNQFVEAYWVYHNPKRDHHEYVFPTGRAQFLFHYGEPFREFRDGSLKIQSSLAIHGATRKPSQIYAPKDSGVVAVILRPWAARGFLPFSIGEITGDSVDLREIFSNGIKIFDSFQRASNLWQRIGTVENFLLSVLSQGLNEDIYRIQRVVNSLETGLIDSSMESWALHFGFSLRSLERKFKDYVGLRPKALEEIFRVNRAVKLLPETDSLTSLGQELGYYDQSHFIRSFKKITGLNPSALRSWL